MEDTKKNVEAESNKETEKPPKKCFCARCFLPIDPEDKVDIDGQNFHRMCSTCSVCHQVPKSLKMFYGHVFCEDCFKNHVLNRFKGEPARMYSNSWWMQWAPGMRAQSGDPQPQTEPTIDETKSAETKPTEVADASKCTTEQPVKKCFCARCLQAVNDKHKVEIDGQTFHPQCCQCYFCHCVPTGKVKIYYGQVFCEECFNRFVMARNKNVPAEHLRSCCEQWANSQFAESMREFMNGKSGNSTVPIVVIGQGVHPPNCRCGFNNQPGWFPGTEPRKCEQTATHYASGEACLSKYHEASDLRKLKESAFEETIEAAAEKIEKLTKYLQHLEKRSKKWKNFIECDDSTASESEQSSQWVNIQDPKIKRDEKCPKCLWQCGPIYVNGACF